MIFFFLLLKIILSFTAVWLIYIKNPIIVAVYFIFITLDLLDSKILKPKQQKEYRPYDTFGDRFYAYSTFLVFLVSRGQDFYPPVVYISAFLLRDVLVFYHITKHKKYTIRSNSFDRITMLATALVFLFQVLEIIPARNFYSLAVSYLLALLILTQSINKINRIKHSELLKLHLNE